MATSSSARHDLGRAIKFPPRIYRAYLAEDYDGISQYVLTKLTHGGVSSAYKARVAAGDHSGHTPMPEGSPVVVTSVNGTLEVLLGQKGHLIEHVISGAFAWWHSGFANFPVPTRRTDTTPGNKLWMVVAQQGATFATPLGTPPLFAATPNWLDGVPGTPDLTWTQHCWVTADSGDGTRIALGLFSRDVRDDEETRTPVQIQPQPTTNYFMSVWCWELPQGMEAGSTLVTWSSDTHGLQSEGAHIQLDNVDGYVFGAVTWAIFDFYHRMEIEAVTGYTVQDTDSSGDGRPAGDPHDGSYNPPGYYGVNPPWTWIGVLEDGGQLEALLTAPLDTPSPTGVVGFAISILNPDLARNRTPFPHINYRFNEDPPWVTTVEVEEV